MGAAGLGGVTGGDGGVTGTTCGTIGVDGELNTTGEGAGGASAEMLLVRTLTFASRGFNAPVDGGVKPPAAGSISSSQAPHW